MSVPTTYATIAVQTDRLGELLMELTPALSSIGMSLQPVLGKTGDAWRIVDDRASALVAADESA